MDRVYLRVCQVSEICDKTLEDAGAVLLIRGRRERAPLPDVGRVSPGLVGGSVVKGVTFRLVDIKDDYGFGSGSAVNSFLERWMVSRGWVIPGDSGFASWNIEPYILAHDLLWKVWCDVLQPVSGVAEDDVSYVCTSNNPVRMIKDHGVKLENNRVFVTESELCELADQLFPVPDALWHEIFSEVKCRYKGPQMLARDICSKIADDLFAVLSQVGLSEAEAYIEFFCDGSGALTESGGSVGFSTAATLLRLCFSEVARV